VRHRRHRRPRWRPLIVDALKRLEYRGYDSAGVATIDARQLARRRAEGKLVNLETQARQRAAPGTIGIGHTRWATHGVPNETNAHPHFVAASPSSTTASSRISASCAPNWQPRGYVFDPRRPTPKSSPISWRAKPRDGRARRGRREGAEAAHRRLRARHHVQRGDEDLMIGARNGPPLAIGHGEGEMYLGSDAIALAPSPTPSPISRTATGR
jgi:glutamine---fructose-6-phosphate transaminase (isomerizing)